MDVIIKRRVAILSLATFFALCLFILHISALNHDLYWVLWWLDMPAHLLGGLVFGLTSSWFILSQFLEKTQQDSLKKFKIQILLAVLFLGIAWELFEGFFGIGFNVAILYPADIFKDIVFDLVGGYIGYLLASHIMKITVKIEE